jgi:uncharacterized protein (DUF362 family)
MKQESKVASATIEETSAPEPVDVVLADSAQGIASALREIFAHFGGAAGLLRASRDVYIKVNAVGDKPYSYVDPNVLRETILHFKERGAREVYVMENCTQANFTRLVFEAIGFTRICKETGATPVFLDETPAIPVFLEGIEQFVDLSRFAFERLVVGRAENLYVSLAKLKTHSMSQVTLSVKNQFGLVHQRSRIADHNYRLHQKLADLYRVLRPDFAIIDGLVATDHGHYFPEYNAPRQVVPMDLLVGGLDPLATDVVAAALMGFALGDVEHLALARETGIGRGAMEQIGIANHALFDARKRQLSCELLHDVPPDLTIVRGEERCCKEGCRLNTESVVEMLYRDHSGKGGFTIVMGKGFDKGAVDGIRGRVHVAGGCAVQELGISLQRRLGARSVTMSPGCNDLALTVLGLCKQMRVHPVKLTSVGLLRTAALLMTARLKGTKANIVPLIG